MYVKLFQKILDSSIWLEKDSTVRVWITLLASMDKEGFCAFASIENLARRARVKPCHTRSAIEILEAPDSRSANDDHEGRRIEKVQGGWVVLNAKKYREITRSGELRSSVKPSQVVSTRFNSSQVVLRIPLTTSEISESVPKAEAYADTDKNKSIGANAPFVLPDWISKDVWQEFEEMRTKARKKLTDGGRRRIVARLDGWRAGGHIPDSILGTSIENGWAGVFEPKSFYGGNGNGTNKAEQRQANNLRACDEAKRMLRMGGGAIDITRGSSRGEPDASTIDDERTEPF